jgi:hypothetical protein
MTNLSVYGYFTESCMSSACVLANIGVMKAVKAEPVVYM